MKKSVKFRLFVYFGEEKRELLLHEEEFQKIKEKVLSDLNLVEFIIKYKNSSDKSAVAAPGPMPFLDQIRRHAEFIDDTRWYQFSRVIAQEIMDVFVD